uniref:Uncharacterized protein n=1 Tax=Arundo donax TaxID=35708 RepID=A0A0A9B6D2_ARUDO
MSCTKVSEGSDALLELALIHP